MSGCDWQNKTFTISVTGNRTKKLCEVCKEYISDYIREANGVKMCKECFNKAISSKEIGLFRWTHFAKSMTDMQGFRIPPFVKNIAR